MTSAWRLELFHKSETDLKRTWVKFLKDNRISKVNLTMKGKEERVLRDVVLLKQLLPGLDVCPHFALKMHHRARQPDHAPGAFVDFCRGVHAADVRDVLLVSGSVGPGPVQAVKKHDSIRALERLSANQEQVPGLRVHCAFNPFFPDQEDRVREQERFLGKLRAGRGVLRGAYLQAGADVALLEEGLAFLRSVTGPSFHLHGSVFRPSKQFLAQMKFRPWNGVYLSDEYYSSVEAATAITRQILSLYRKHGVTPLVESKTATTADLLDTEELLRVDHTAHAAQQHLKRGADPALPTAASKTLSQDASDQASKNLERKTSSKRPKNSSSGGGQPSVGNEGSVVEAPEGAAGRVHQSDGPPIPLADAHVHYWTPDTHLWLNVVKEDPSHPFHKFGVLAGEYLPRRQRSELAASGLQVRETVYVQANMGGGIGGFSANEEVAMKSGMAMADECGWPNAVVGWCPLHEGRKVSLRVLEGCMRYPQFRGVRFMLDWHPERAELRQTDRGDYMTDPKFLEGVEVLGELGLSFDLQVCQCQLPEAAKFVSRFPKVQFILNHAGFPLRGQFDDWRRDLAVLAANPNVACKMGGFGAYDTPTFSPEETAAHVHECLRLFGADRCLFSSNWPVDLIDMTPSQRWGSYWAAVQSYGCSDADIAKLFRGNCLRLYKIEPCPT